MVGTFLQLIAVKAARLERLCKPLLVTRCGDVSYVIAPLVTLALLSCM